jgi:toxin ParE1/3/4
VRRLRLVIRPEADRDLDDHYDYIAQDNLDVAMRLLEAAHATLDELAELPGREKPRLLKNPRLSGLRQWPIRGFSNYLIFYLTTEEAVEVVRVLHGARDLERILEGEEGE